MTPASWIGRNNYNVVPATIEPDVLLNMFGGVDRNLPCPIDNDINVIARPKRNAATPAWYLCLIYAVPNNLSFNEGPLQKIKVKNELSECYVDNYRTRRCDNNDVVCLYLFRDMKKANKKSDEEMKKLLKKTPAYE